MGETDPDLDDYQDYRFVGETEIGQLAAPEWTPWPAQLAAFAAVRAAGLGAAPRAVKLDWMYENGHHHVADYFNGHVVNGWVINQ